MKLISTKHRFVSTTEQKGSMSHIAFNYFVLKNPVNKFVILLQGLLLLVVYGFSQEEAASSIKAQVKIADSLAITINAHDNYPAHSIVGRDSLIGNYKGKIFSNAQGNEVFKIIIQPDSTQEQFVLYCAKKSIIKVENGGGAYYGFNKQYFDKDSHLLQDSLILQKMKSLETVPDMIYKLLNTEP